MIISKSLPLQFWLTDDPTYNEAEICGVYPDCFCEHVNNDQTLTFQFNHSEALTLKAYDYRSGSLLESEAMTSIATDYYQSSFVPNEFVGNEFIKVIYFTVTNGSGTVLARTGCVVIGGCITSPETAVLTFLEHRGILFHFTLNVPILSDLVITNATALGSNVSNCSPNGDNKTSNSLTYDYGESGEKTVDGTPVGPFSGPTDYYRRGSTITVNGEVKSNGDTIMVGGTLVTIVISNTCEPL